MKKGDTVRMRVTVPQGEILSIKFDEDTGEKRILMGWTDSDGQTQERWFMEDELELASA